MATKEALTGCLRRSIRTPSRCTSSRPRGFATATEMPNRQGNRERVHVVEVGPRDGLQNEKGIISLETKNTLIDRLVKAGCSTIEAGSFVSPKWTPQMANSSEILTRILENPPKNSSSDPTTYQFLVPNQKGMENFVTTFSSTPESASATTNLRDPPTLGRKPEIEVSIFTAATETFAHKNTNCSVAESLERFKSVFSAAKEKNLRVRAYISVALGCPYEGPDVDPKRVADLAISLLEMGSHEICVADTTGMGTATRTRTLLKTLAAAGIEPQDLALHFHDTYGQALVNTVVGLEAGIRTFDSAVAGLGGCPYSPGATGNIATEDSVHLFESLGLDTGIDMRELCETGAWISEEIGKGNESRAGKATLARLSRLA